MLTRTLTAFVLAATPQVPTPPCKLAGPPVEAHWSGAIPPASTAEAPLRLVADVPLPGSASRFDYQSLARGGGGANTQSAAGSPGVFVAFQTATHRAAIDRATATIVRRVTLDKAIRYPHGFYIDAPHRLTFVSGQESGTLGVLDLRTLRLRQVLPIGGDPDVLAFDPSLGRLYVAAESGVVAVVEERGGSPGQLGWYRAPQAHSVAVDPATHRVYLPLANVSGHPVLRVLVPSDAH